MSLALAGCSGYMKLQRTGTNQEKYSAAMHYLNAGKNQKVIDLLGAVRPAYVGKSQQDSIDYFTALAYYRLGDYETSGALFDQFRKSYGNGRSVFMEDAEFLYADGLYRSSPPPNRDQNETILAIMAADEYLGHYPNSEYRPYMLDNMEELQDKLKEKSYINAKLYYTTGEYKSAVVALRNSLEQDRKSVV